MKIDKTQANEENIFIDLTTHSLQTHYSYSQHNQREKRAANTQNTTKHRNVLQIYTTSVSQPWSSLFVSVKQIAVVCATWLLLGCVVSICIRFHIVFTNCSTNGRHMFELMKKKVFYSGNICKLPEHCMMKHSHLFIRLSGVFILWLCTLQLLDQCWKRNTEQYMGQNQSLNINAF